jgi:hypothetical protein
MAHLRGDAGKRCAEIAPFANYPGGFYDHLFWSEANYLTLKTAIFRRGIAPIALRFFYCCTD